MGQIVILGVFVADTTFRAARMPKMGETILGDSFVLGPGGKGSNQAVAAGKLGGDVSFITRLGKDDFAKLALKTWQDAQVKPAIIEDEENNTGAAFIFVDTKSGDNAIIIAPGAAGKITPDILHHNKTLITESRIFMTQLEQPVEVALEGLKLAREHGKITILNPAPAASLPDEIFGLCDYITPNETETEALTGLPVHTLEEAEKAAHALAQKGVGTPIITMGAQGAYLYGHGLIPAYHAGEVVETTGAGDAFNGALATALAEGQTDIQAVHFGCATSAIAVTRAGAAPSMPARKEVEKFLASQKGA
jgi:ribokinase